MAVNMSLQNISAKKDIPVCQFSINEIREIYEEIKSAQNEVGGTIAYRAKVASGGGKAFDILTGDEDNDTSVTSFSGVIIHNHKCNARFDEDSSGNTPPLCASTDGIEGMERESGELLRCPECPHNEYGTSKNGKGKACKNMHRLYILTENNPIPLVLSLPPTSLKAWQNYRLSVLAANKLKPHDVLTEFSLLSETSAGGQKYSTVKFKLIGKLNGEAAAFALFMANSFTPNIEVSADDYNRRENTEEVREN